MDITVSSGIYLTQITEADKLPLLKYINNPDIYNYTLKIPYPYKEEDADFWINFVEELRIKDRVLKHWAIKNENDELIGGIGFHSKYGKHSHKDEIGYWLGKPFWNKGIMTDVVKKVCEIGFEEFNLTRIEAMVFNRNTASKKVLYKAGFVLEGTLKKFYLKDDKFIDADLFARLR
jgi:RimJ/RimL family protein N-acetyltransferase